MTLTVPSAPSQGFFRKGNVLLEMGQQTEALIQFHRCLKLQADFAPAKTQIRKVCSSHGSMHYTCRSFSCSDPTSACTGHFKVQSCLCMHHSRNSAVGFFFFFKQALVMFCKDCTSLNVHAKQLFLNSSHFNSRFKKCFVSVLFMQIFSCRWNDLCEI